MREAEIPVTFQPGDKTAKHKHLWPHYGYMLEGVLTITNSETGQSFDVKPGEFLVEMQNTAHVGENRFPHGGDADDPQGDKKTFNGERCDDVLPDYALCFPGYLNCPRDFEGGTRHDDHVGGFNRDVGAIAHGDSDVRARDDRRVVDAVAHESQLFPGLDVGKKAFDNL